MGAMMAKRRQQKTLKKIAATKKQTQEELNPENAMILPPVFEKEFLDKKKKKK